MVSNLPSEMLFRIFSYLPELKDLCSCSCVCRRWRDLLDDDSCVWENKLHELWHECPKFTDDQLLATMPSPKAKLVAYYCSWNDSDRSKNIYIKENKLTLHRNPVSQSSDAIRGKVGFTSGVHYWVVIWHGPKLGSTAVVGVATKQARLQDNGYYPLIGCDEDSWGWDIPGCQLRHSGQEVQRYPKENDYKVDIKQEIGVTLDMDNLTLSFEVDGRYLGLAFTDLPRGQRLYPAISAVYGHSEVSLIYYGRPLVG